MVWGTLKNMRPLAGWSVPWRVSDAEELPLSRDAAVAHDYLTYSRKAHASTWKTMSAAWGEDSFIVVMIAHSYCTYHQCVHTRRTTSMQITDPKVMHLHMNMMPLLTCKQTWHSTFDKCIHHFWHMSYICTPTLHATFVICATIHRIFKTSASSIALNSCPMWSSDARMMCLSASRKWLRWDILKSPLPPDLLYANAIGNQSPLLLVCSMKIQ